MAREVTVTLGGRDFVLRFTTREAIELKRRFGKTPKALLGENINPIDEGGRPTLDFDPEVVVAALFLGIRHTSRKFTEADVEKWFDDICRTGIGALAVLNPLVDEFLLSGITGKSIDLEEVQSRLAAAEAANAPRAVEAEDQEGKAVRPPDNPV